MKEKKISLSLIGVLCFMLSSFFVFSEDKSIENIKKLNIPKEFNENILIENYKTQIVDYDFNKDGIKEKVLLNFKEDNNGLETFISIYVLENNKYYLKYQFPFEEKINIFNINYGKKQIEKIKQYYNEYSKNIGTNEVRYIKILNNNIKEKINIDLKYDKHSPKDLDNFLFIETNINMLKNPLESSEVVSQLKYSNKAKILFEIFQEIDGNNNIWYFTEIKQGENLQKGFVNGNGKIIKRGFYWDKMYNKMNALNMFIEEAKNNNQELYIIKEYRPMIDDVYSRRDKFGNRTNQSVFGYEKHNKQGEIVNIPDRTIFKILSKKDKMLEIESPYYGKYFIEDKSINYEKWNIKEEINKFIVMDTHSQTEAVFEKKNNKYNAITYSFVTTGKDNGYSSYETPKGIFSVAYTRPYMAFGKKVIDEETQREKVEISGTAKGAVRFSGGGYMHGIPVSKDNEKYIRPIIEGKIGTYKESHKCVRHYDDQIDFIMKWINGDGKPEKGDKLIPEEPVVVIVI